MECKLKLSQWKVLGKDCTKHNKIQKSKIEQKLYKGTQLILIYKVYFLQPWAYCMLTLLPIWGSWRAEYYVSWG